jgi:hypothetical protein
MNAVKCTKKQSQTVAFDAEEGQCAYFYSKINDKRCFLVFEAIGTFFFSFCTMTEYFTNIMSYIHEYI